jgi:hypothetical protein
MAELDGVERDLAPSVLRAGLLFSGTWPVAALKGSLLPELKIRRQFEQAASSATEDEVARMGVCGPAPERHYGAIGECLSAGFDHIAIHQIGPEHEDSLNSMRRKSCPNSLMGRERRHDNSSRS